MAEIIKNKSILLIEEIPFLCRICLKKNNVIDISKVRIGIVDIQTVFETVFHDKLFLDEPDKPKSLCTECVESLTESYKFVNLYNDSKKTLDEFLLFLAKKQRTEPVDRKTDIPLIVDNNFDCPRIDVVKLEEPDAKDDDNVFSLTRKEKYIKCDLCGKWIYRNNFPRHKKSVHDSEKKRAPPIGVSVVCGVCDQRMWRNSLIKHFESKHKGEQVQINPEKTINYKRKAECDICGKEISGQNFLRHYKMHQMKLERNKKENNINCEICNKKFTAKCNLIEHYKSAHEEVPLVKNEGYKVKKKPPISRIEYERCGLCDERLSKTNLSSHFKLMHNGAQIVTKAKDLPRYKRKSICDICGKQVLSPNLLKHRQLHADEKVPLEKKVCESCGKQFRNKTDLMEHFKSVHEGNPFECAQCSKSFTRKRNLQEHVNRKHVKEAKKVINPDRFIVCDICGRQTPKNKRRSLILHDAFHRFGHKVMCPVAECELTFADTPSRLNHLANDHEKLTCNQCHKDFFDHIRFQAHCQVHLWHNKTDVDPDLKLSICRICDHNFDSNQTLAKHLLNVHKIYWCLINNDCFKMYVTRGAYSFHIANHKNEANRFKCKLCPREFATQSAYLLHEKGHNNSEGHKCSICNYAFNKATKLKIHMRIHTGEKPFQCSFCSKSFISMCRKKMHERYHTGEKPYVCQYCKKGFASRIEYSKHVAYEKRTNQVSLKASSAIEEAEETNQSNFI